MNTFATSASHSVVFCIVNMSSPPPQTLFACVLCVGDGRRKAEGEIKGDAIRRHDTIAENIFGGRPSVMAHDGERDSSDRRGLLEKAAASQSN